MEQKGKRQSVIMREMSKLVRDYKNEEEKEVIKPVTLNGVSRVQR